VTPYVVGNSVYLRFRYDTKDAMGMNMATIATGPSAASSKPRQPPRSSPSRATSVPTKSPPPSTPSRGAAGASPPTFRSRAGVVEERLHHARSGRGTHTRKNLVGSAKAASLGFNAHVANVVAAMFLATGQDGAQVVEGANAITTAEVQDGDLYVSVSIASLEVGTVGGGTKLPTQSGASISSASAAAATAGSNADALARCIAVGSLAGELSLLSALASRHLSSAPPNSVGNCMGVVVRPRFMGFRVRRPYSNHERTVSRDTTRLRDTQIQRISRTYYQRLVQSRTCLREGCCAISGPIDSV